MWRRWGIRLCRVRGPSAGGGGGGFDYTGCDDLLRVSTDSLWQLLGAEDAARSRVSGRNP
jgi:hypothetical protein